MGPTEHRFPKLLYIREGSGQIKTTADMPSLEIDINCDPGDCFFVPSRTRHRIVDDPRQPISLYGLAIDPSRMPPCECLDTILPFGRLPRHRVSMLGVERRIRRLLYLVSQDNSGSVLSSIAGAIETFAQLALAAGANGQSSQLDPTANSTDAIDEYIVWLDSNFFETLTVDDAADVCGMSRRKFTQNFRQRTSMTWLAYLNKRRIDHAVERLTQTDNKVTSIAFQSGFEDLSTFYRAFKRLTGRKPLEFRSASAINRPS